MMKFIVLQSILPFRMICGPKQMALQAVTLWTEKNLSAQLSLKVFQIKMLISVFEDEICTYTFTQQISKSSNNTHTQ